MFRLNFRRTTLSLIALAEVLFFAFSLFYLFFYVDAHLPVLEIVYYAITLVLVLSVFVLILFYSSSSVFRDVHRYMVHGLLFLMLFAILDVYVRSLYFLVDIDNALFYLIKIRYFVSLLVIGSFFSEEYRELFYKKSTSEIVNLLLFFLSFILAVLIPPSENTNLHLLILMALVVLITFFHSLIDVLSDSELKPSLKVFTLIFINFEMAGAFLYTAFNNIIVSFVGLVLLLVSFLIFGFINKKE